MNIDMPNKAFFADFDDKLGIALIIAIAFHALVILGIGFGMGEPGKQELPKSLEVTLVNTRSDKPIEEADYLAQSNQEGGGNSEDKVRPETLFQSMAPSESLNVTSPSPPTYVPAPEQPKTRNEFLTQDLSEQKIRTDEDPVKETETHEKTAAELISQSMDIASLEAEIGRSVQAYAKLPRNKIVTARTKEYKYASYMDSWRRKVERVGNLNFPAEARKRKLSGDLILDVVINSDGTIRKIDVLKSSKHKLLDDAAMRIVHMAAPFAPFTDDIKKETDVLHVIRTWKFMGDGVSAR